MEIRGHNLLDDVLPEDYFEIGSSIVKNLSELVDAIVRMSDEDFRFYVYGDQNDFAEWIMEAYWDEDLAGKVLKSRDKKKILKILRVALDNSKKSGKIKSPKKKKDVLKEIGSLE